MQVKIDIAFPSGAKVELSKGEVSQVSKFIHEMLFKENRPTLSREVKKRKKTKSYVYWTAADIDRIAQIGSMSAGAEKTRAIRQLSLDSGHSKSAIANRMYRQKNLNKNAAPFGLLN